MSTRPGIRAAAFATALAVVLLGTSTSRPALARSYVPPEKRGQIAFERAGTHDANNVRTVYWNYGMVGDYPVNPGSVDLSVFHSVEAPKGSGMNYSDGITPFVLAKVNTNGGLPLYLMETGYRERQAQSYYRNNHDMRFEPRPGYFDSTNAARSPAISNDPSTWPPTWPDRDTTWNRKWNGYFGQRPAADQESFSVMDDDFYDTFDFEPDTLDPGSGGRSGRHGLGLRVEVRGFQWSNPQAGNVIFWHYDIANEGTTDYQDNIIFGLYMDSGVGGSQFSPCDGVYESDDDNAYFDRSFGLNLVYTWDKNGHGVDLSGTCSPTGYMGYAYLETPGNPDNGLDDDRDGITDEKRDNGPGQRIEGKDAIRAYVQSHYDLNKFEAYYGPLENRPAYRAGVWWTGDEDMDWIADQNDVGEDGVAKTNDPGEGDGIPTEGEPNFDRTDLNESDQIGLTGFKMNRINSQSGDNILFYTESSYKWPERLYGFFTSSFPYDSALVANYNIGFLFASGPFHLASDKRERFSLALGYGADLSELRETVRTVQIIYNANYQFAVPPTMPTLHAEAGDGKVRLSWDNVAERSIDPVSLIDDFEGYRIYRSTDPTFLDPKVMVSGRGNPLPVNGKPMAQWDLKDDVRGYSDKTVSGVAYWLGDDTGLTHTWTDTTVTNGQEYWYAVTSYDFGSPESVPDSLRFYPSENAIAVSRNRRGTVIKPVNVQNVRPNPQVQGLTPATTGSLAHVAGHGTGTVAIDVLQSGLVPEGHLFKLTFATPDPDSLRATTYALWDSTTGKPLFAFGSDMNAAGHGPAASGLLPIVGNPALTEIDTARTRWAPGSQPNPKLTVIYNKGPLDPNRVRPGYGDDMTVTFDDVVRDTSVATGGGWSVRPIKFFVTAHTPQGDLRLKVRFREDPIVPTYRDSTLDATTERFDILTPANVSLPDSQVTWQVQFPGPQSSIRKPHRGDVFEIKVNAPLSSDDVYTFTSTAQRVDAAAAKSGWSEKPYVVPNPYAASASFEPARFAVSGRGERRIEFRSIPQNSTIRIYTVRGSLVQTLHQDGGTAGFVAWDLRTKDNLDIAPGLYIFRVDAPGIGDYVGKFAIIK